MIQAPLTFMEVRSQKSILNTKEEQIFSYAEAVVKGLIFENERLNLRVCNMVLTSEPQSLIWLNQKHSMNMYEADYNLGFHLERNTNSFYATMYLMIANQELVNRSWWCFSKYGIDFKRIRLRGISPQLYAVLMPAKEIYTGQEYISESDLANPEIIDDTAFKLIINAKLIKRFGVGFLQFGNGG